MAVAIYRFVPIAEPGFGEQHWFSNAMTAKRGTRRSMSIEAFGRKGQETGRFAPSGIPVESAARELGLPLLDLSAFDPEFLPRDLFSEPLTPELPALPLMKRGKSLFLAISDPSNQRAIDDLRFRTGLSVEPVLVEQGKLAALIGRLTEPARNDGLGELEGDGLEEFDLAAFEPDEEEQEAEAASAADDTPVVRFVNRMLLDAIKRGVSDIHFEPYASSYRVRFRTDGILHEASAPPAQLGKRLAARLKVMSALDISERRIPQDGRIKMKLSRTRAIDFRVNTLPTLWGEKVVLRVLDPDSTRMGIDSLGFDEAQKALFLEALQSPQGMILVTGPTGSGKTVTLYSGLNLLNTPERNIATAEDPVEINLDGINQVNVNPKVGLDFAAALRAFLRQDPDVVMVGEIRDVETAEIAVKAAQTGHLVLSTLHTNSAVATLSRLRNMGIPAFNLATSVDLIVAQRLARRLCTHCRREAALPAETLLAEGFTAGEVSAGFRLHQPGEGGCEACNNGYRGRVGIYEVVKVTPSLARLIMKEADTLQLAGQAGAEGFRNLRRSALDKALAGVTSLAEVNRVTTAHQTGQEG